MDRGLRVRTRRAFIGNAGVRLLQASAMFASTSFGEPAPVKLGVLGDPTLALVPGAMRFWSSFLGQLQQHGWIQGRNLAVMERGRVGTLYDQAVGLVGMRPDVLLALGTAQVQVLARLTSQIPIVWIAAVNPLGSKLVASLARPGGNITGVSMVLDELLAKVLAMIQEWSPRARRIDVLADAAGADLEWAARFSDDVLRPRGLTSQILAVRTPEELEATIANTLADALLVGSELMFLPHLKRIADAAMRRKLPTAWAGGLGREAVAAGLLFSYCANNEEVARRSADCVDRVLRGAKPAELPFEQPTRYDYIINRRTASAIGVAIPRGHLIRADEVIE